MISMLNALSKRANRTAQEELPTINSAPNTIHCPETQYNCVCCCILNYCPGPPQFDSNPAKNHLGLTSLAFGGSDTEIDEKFSTLHEKLRKNHINPYYWIVPLILFGLVGIFVVTYIESSHQIQCRSTDICSQANLTLGERGACPTSLEGTNGCCTALCYRLFEDSDSREDQGCFADEMLDRDIQSNTSFGLKCHCKPCNHCKNKKTFCGRVHYYGDFMDLPGNYASPGVTGIFKIIFSLLPFPIAIAGFFYSWYKSSKVPLVIQEHFLPWKDKGIDVQYRAPRTVGRRQKEAGRIILTLPSTMSDPNYIPTQDN